MPGKKIVVMCCVCRKIKVREIGFVAMSIPKEFEVSHGYCPDCVKNHIHGILSEEVPEILKLSGISYLDNKTDILEAMSFAPEIIDNGFILSFIDGSKLGLVKGDEEIVFVVFKLNDSSKELLIRASPQKEAKKLLNMAVNIIELSKKS